MKKLSVRHSTLIIVFAIAAGVFLFSQAASAATYYVDASATGAQTGLNWENAWTTLGQAQAVLQGGDICYIRNGNYGNFNEGTGAARSNWITYRADDGHNSVNLSGISVNHGGNASYLRFEGININGHTTLNNTSYIYFYKCKFTGSHFNENTHGINSTTTGTVPYVTIEDCEISHFWRGILVRGNSYWTIKNCHIHYLAEDGINLGAAAEISHILIEGNEINDITYVGRGVGTEHEDCIHYEVPVASTDIKIVRNKCHDCRSQGISVYAQSADVTGVVLENNLVYGIGAYAFQIEGTEDIDIINNTVIDKETPAAGIRFALAHNTDDTIITNFYNNIASRLVVDTNRPAYSVNVINNNNNIFGSIVPASPPNFTPGPNTLNNQNLSSGYFVDYINDDYRLASSSATRSFADPAHAPATDILGTPRDAQPDAGCYEYIPAPVADFTASPVTGKAPLIVNFTDASTGNITSWSWNFGDGGASNEANPSHAYTVAGTYTVALTVIGPGGSDTETKTNYIVAVNTIGMSEGLLVKYNEGDPDRRFGVFISDSNFSTIKDFFNTAKRYWIPIGPIMLGNIEGYEWSFCHDPDQIQLAEAAAEIFDASARYIEDYPPQKWITDYLYWGPWNHNLYSYELKYPTIHAEVLVKGMSGTIYSNVEFEWNVLSKLNELNPPEGEAIGSGRGITNDSGVIAFDTYYDLETLGDLTITCIGPTSPIYGKTANFTLNPSGTNNFIFEVNDYPPPIADFTASPTQGEVPLTVQFTNASTGNITTYLWNFGDGTEPSIDENPSHTYNSSGIFTATLSVSGPGGSDEKSITITSTYDSELIQDAIDIAPEGSIVTLTPGIYILSADLKITKNIKLLGTGGPDSNVINMGQYRIYIKNNATSPVLNNVTLEGITIRGHGGLGAVWNYAKTLTLKDCKLIDNIGMSVSAIFTDDFTNLILDNCLVANNKNMYYSGSFGYLYGGGYWDSKGKWIKPTKADYLHGVIHLDNATLTIRNSTIANNINEIREDTAVWRGILTYFKYGAIAMSPYSRIVDTWTGTRFEPGILNSIIWNNGRDATPKGEDIIQPCRSLDIYGVVTIKNSCVQLNLLRLVSSYSYTENVIQEDPLLDSNYIPQNPNCATMGARF